MRPSTVRRTTGLLAALAVPVVLLGLPGAALAGGPVNDADASAEPVGGLPATIAFSSHLLQR